MSSLRARDAHSRRAERGAVMVEFLIAYLPVLTAFLMFWQLGEVLVAQMIVERASSAAGRAAIVVLPDDPAFYEAQDKGRYDGARKREIRLAAGMILAASPHLSENFTVDVADIPAGDDTVGELEVKVEAEFRCKRLTWVCGADGLTVLGSSSRHTYHGAAYQYEPTDLTNLGQGSSSPSADPGCSDTNTSGSGGSGNGNQGSGGTPGKGDGFGSGGKGSGGKGSSGNGGASPDDSGSCPPGQTANKDGTCSTSKGSNLCNDGEYMTQLGKCASCSGAPNPKPADCSQQNQNCTEQRSAGTGGNKLSGDFVVAGDQVNIPEFGPGTGAMNLPICTSGCTAASGAGVDDAADRIIDEVRKRQFRDQCKATGNPADPWGQREAMRVRQWSLWLENTTSDPSSTQFHQYWGDCEQECQQLGPNTQIPAGYVGLPANVILDCRNGRSLQVTEAQACVLNKATAEYNRRVANGSQPSGTPPATWVTFHDSISQFCTIANSTPANDANAESAANAALNAYNALPDLAQKKINQSLNNTGNGDHTEPKLIALLKKWSQKSNQALSGGTLDLTGDWSPCEGCDKDLKKFAQKEKVTVRYCWTKGIYTSGPARGSEFVQGAGGLISGNVAHKGCITYAAGSGATSMTGGKLCPK